LANACIILDEAQNTTSVQMKMFLTRLGKNSQMVVTGDLTQIDLPNGVESGLHNAMNTLNQVEGVKFINFDESDVIRHSLVARIVNAYSRFQNQNKLKKTPNGE
jgi:phosphate starvation-inducible PhoH-like protein